VRRVIESLTAIALAAALGCSGTDMPETGDAPELSVSITPDSAGLGDPVRLRIEAILPAGAIATFPGNGDSIGAWKVLHAPAAEEAGRGEMRRWVREITVAAFRLGWCGPDSIRLFVQLADGDSLRLACEAPGLLIGGELAGAAAIDPASARDIRDVVSTRAPRWPWIAFGAVLLLAVAFFLIRWRRSRRRVGDELVAQKHLSPAEEFEAAIAKLLASGMLEDGRYREFYYGVSGAVRLYLERLHGLPLLESSSGEVARLLTPKLGDETERSALHGWLHEGDLVKYARMERLQAEALQYLERSRSLVDLLAGSVVPEGVQEGGEA
jgi:hypothetical protein